MTISAAAVVAEIGSADRATELFLKLAYGARLSGASAVQMITDYLIDFGEQDKAMEILLWWLDKGFKVEVEQTKVLSQLEKLERSEKAVGILLSLMRDDQIEVLLRINAASVLVTWNNCENVVEFLRTVSNDAKLDGYHRVTAARLIGKCGYSYDATTVLTDIAHSKINNWLRQQIVEILKALGHQEQVFEVWLAAIRDTQLDLNERKQAVSNLSGILSPERTAKELLALMNDHQLVAGMPDHESGNLELHFIRALAEMAHIGFRNEMCKINP